MAKNKKIVDITKEDTKKTKGKYGTNAKGKIVKLEDKSVLLKRE